jgi:hypothetical protein
MKPDFFKFKTTAMNEIEVLETSKSLRGVLVKTISRNFLENHDIAEINSVNFQYELNRHLRFKVKVSELETEDGALWGHIAFRNENGVFSVISFVGTPVNQTV